MNLALLTDGLRAEREQGITIDVAYRYFATPKRKFIIADTPGHVQYTRNMVTGASTADLALILIDARNGILEQSRRHAFLASLLGVPHLVLCVNKMDLVDYDQAVFERIKAEFTRLRGQARRARPHVHPDLGAARRQRRRPLRRTCRGTRARSLLHHLEDVHIALRPQPDRLPVPGAVRDPPARRHATTTTAATPARSRAAPTRSGDEVVVLPSGFTSTIAAIDTADGPVDEAVPPMSVTIRLADDLDVSRGDMICRPNNRRASARTSTRWSAGSASAPSSSPAPSTRSSTRAKWARALVKDLHYRLDVNTLHRDETARLARAQRDRPGHAAHDAAALLRRVPPQPRDRLVHPRRRGHERHRRRGHDPLVKARIAGDAAPTRNVGAWCTKSRRPDSAIRPTTKRRGRRTRPTRSRGSSTTCGIAPGRRVARPRGRHRQAHPAPRCRVGAEL